MTESKSSSVMYHTLSVEATLKKFGVTEHSGLSSESVAKNLEIYGKNEIPAPPGTSIFTLILGQFEDLLVLILLGAAVVSFLLALLEDGEDRVTAFVEPAVIAPVTPLLPFPTELPTP